MITSRWGQSGFTFLFVVLVQVIFCTSSRADCIGSSDRQNWSPCGSGGGYAAPRYVAPPVYQGPSQAELAAQRQRAAALAANDRGTAARKRGDLAEAVRDFEEATRLAPSDSNIQGNYWNAKGELAHLQQHDYGHAIDFYKKALQYYPGQKDILKRLAWAQGNDLRTKALTALETANWDEAIRIQREAIAVTQKLYNPSHILDLHLLFVADLNLLVSGQAIAKRDWSTAAHSLSDYNNFLRKLSETLGDQDGLKAVDGADAVAAAIARGDLSTALRVYDEIAKISPTTPYGEDRDHAALREEITQQIARQEEAHPQRDTAGSAYEQAKEANAHGGAGAEEAKGMTGSFTVDLDEAAEKAKRQASKPFDRPGIHQGGDDDVHFQRSAAASPDMYNMGLTDAMMRKLEQAKGGHEVIQQEQTWRDKLQQSNNNIAEIKSKLSAAQGDEKERLMEAWTNELNEQPAINQKLNEIEQQARQLVTQVVLDPAGASAAPKEPPSPATQAGSSRSN